MSKKEYPVVCRFAGMKPRDLGGYEAHRYRKGGDVGHVNRRRSRLNRRLIGPADWARQAMAEIRTMAMETYAAELETLQKRGDRKRLALRLAEGPKDPWRASRHGPLREVILTVNKEWFEKTDDPNTLFSTKNEQDFEDRAVAWLQQNFGDDVIHARADLDEEAYHIHAVIMPRATVNKYGVECRVLQPSIHPLIKDYEEAQDSVGRWFEPLGLVRGERRKQAIRDALNDGRTPPPKRRHVRPADWRRNEERRLAQKGAEIERRKRSVEAKDREARDTLAYAEAVGAGQVDVEAADASASAKPSQDADADDRSGDEVLCRVHACAQGVPRGADADARSSRGRGESRRGAQPGGRAERDRSGRRRDRRDRRHVASGTSCAGCRSAPEAERQDHRVRARGASVRRAPDAAGKRRWREKIRVRSVPYSRSAKKFARTITTPRSKRATSLATETDTKNHPSRPLKPDDDGD